MTHGRLKLSAHVYTIHYIISPLIRYPPSTNATHAHARSHTTPNNLPITLMFGVYVPLTAKHPHIFAPFSAHTRAFLRTCLVMEAMRVCVCASRAVAALFLGQCRRFCGAQTPLTRCVRFSKRAHPTPHPHKKMPRALIIKYFVNSCRSSGCVGLLGGSLRVMWSRPRFPITQRSPPTYANIMCVYVVCIMRVHTLSEWGWVCCRWLCEFISTPCGLTP